MGSRSKVLVTDSRYEACAEAVAAAFAAFPLAVRGKKVVVKVNAIRGCDPDHSAIVTHPDLVSAVVDRLETMGPREIVVGDSVGTESYGHSDHVFRSTGRQEPPAVTTAT